MDVSLEGDIIVEQCNEHIKRGLIQILWKTLLSNDK